MTPKKSSGNHKNAKKCCDRNCPRRGLKDPDFQRLRPRQKCLRVSDLVYKFLEDVASLNDERRQRNNARTNFQRAHVRKCNKQSRKPDDPRITDEILLQSRYQMPKNFYLKSNFSDWPSMEKENILEDCDATEILENKSSSQFVEDYVKAVNESKRRAERYITKALSFGVEAGFLVPGVDSEGQVLRVSSALEVNVFKQNMDCGNETEADDRENRDTCSCHRGNGQNLKSDESMSCMSTKKRSKPRSEKSKNREKELESTEKKRPRSSRPAKKRRGKSIGGYKAKNNKPEANDSDDSDTEKSLSGLTNEKDNVSNSTNSDSSLKSSNKKRRVTDSDKNPEDAEVAKNDDEENHEEDASEATDYEDNKNHETKNN